MQALPTAPPRRGAAKSSAGDAPARDEIEPVGDLAPGRAMGDGDDGIAAAQGGDVAADFRLRLGIKRARHLIENEHGGLDHQRARNRDALALAARKLAAHRADIGRQSPSGKEATKSLAPACARASRMRSSLIVSSPSVTFSRMRAVQQVQFLRHIADHAAPGAHVDVAQIDAIDRDVA